MRAGTFVLLICAWAPSLSVAGDDALDLLFPVPAVPVSAMANSFGDDRGGRLHHAVDIMAPRHAEVVAVADGTVARLMTSAAGGIAVYQWSEDGRLVFYYAHLQGYAAD